MKIRLYQVSPPENGGQRAVRFERVEIIDTFGTRVLNLGNATVYCEANRMKVYEYIVTGYEKKVG